MSRTIELHTSLGSDQIRFASLRGVEAISHVGEFEFQALSPAPDLDPDHLLGTAVAIEIEAFGGGTRYFQALVSEFAYMGPDSSAELQHRYRASLRSWLMVADQNADYKIFQHKIGRQPDRCGDCHCCWQRCDRHHQLGRSRISRGRAVWKAAAHTGRDPSIGKQPAWPTNRSEDGR